MKVRQTEALHLDPAIALPVTSRPRAVRKLLVALVFMSAILLLYTWGRLSTRGTALAIETASSQVAALRVQNERLKLELSSMKNVGALHARAMEAALVEDVQVVEVR